MREAGWNLDINSNQATFSVVELVFPALDIIRRTGHAGAAT
jgi:hypothetical protein